MRIGGSACGLSRRAERTGRNADRDGREMFSRDEQAHGEAPGFAEIGPDSRATDILRGRAHYGCGARLGWGNPARSPACLLSIPWEQYVRVRFNGSGAKSKEI